jgi:catechol 2,3-dioxygenase-like lactoylglutathione lyase family enzyme
MKINGLIEVILYINDMQAQVTFYRDILGLPVLYPVELDDFSHEHWVTLDTGACILALHSGGRGKPADDNGSQGPATKIVFGVDDIHHSRAHLLSLGVSLGNVRMAAPAVWVCDGEDPEGNPFSIESYG